jgi:methylenetetrahydrofolate reductase (NADPH)
MKLNNVFNFKRPTLSFEVFPPKQDTNYELVKRSTLEIAALKPSYMSVTYGAGGSTDKYTLDIAKNILNTHNIIQDPFYFKIIKYYFFNFK